MTAPGPTGPEPRRTGPEPRRTGLGLLHRRVLHLVDYHGPVNALLNILRTLRARVQKTPPPEARPGGAPGFVHPFDLAHGVDTSGFLPGEALAPGGEAGLYNNAYYAISPSSLRDALNRIPDDLGGFSFVDIGSGKGRALLVAAELPFQQLLGVELAPELAQVGAANTARDPRIRVEQGDACALVFPETPLVVFLYHPFLAPVLKRFVSHLEASWRSSPRTIFLLYANPSYGKVLARFGSFLEPVWEYNLPLSAEDAAADRHGLTHEHYSLYRSRR